MCRMPAAGFKRTGITGERDPDETVASSKRFGFGGRICRLGCT
jgi:hypothetical protein